MTTTNYENTKHFVDGEDMTDLELRVVALESKHAMQLMYKQVEAMQLQVNRLQDKITRQQVDISGLQMQVVDQLTMKT